MNVERTFEGIDDDSGTYDDTVKEHNTNIDCDHFCKNMSSPENCVSFNTSPVQKCLNKNNAPIKPNCHYDTTTDICINAV